MEPVLSSLVEFGCEMHGRICRNPFDHHAFKYHDPNSEYYVGTQCSSCVIAELEKRWQKDMLKKIQKILEEMR